MTTPAAVDTPFSSRAGRGIERPRNSSSSTDRALASADANFPISGVPGCRRSVDLAELASARRGLLPSFLSRAGGDQRLMHGEMLPAEAERPMRVHVRGSSARSLHLVSTLPQFTACVLRPPRSKARTRGGSPCWPLRRRARGSRRPSRQADFPGARSGVMHRQSRGRRRASGRA